MLSSQINYFLGPIDQKGVEEIIEADGRFHFLRQPLLSSSVSLSATIPSLQERQWPLFMMLVRPGDEHRIGLRFIETQGYYLGDPLAGHALEYGRCFLDDKIIRRSRMCFFATSFDLAGIPQPKDPDFVRDARSLFRKVKRQLTLLGNGFYAGPEALELQEKGVTFSQT